MLLLFIFLVIISATVASISFFLNRRKSLPPHSQETFKSPTTYRSLFAPDEEELQVWQKEQAEKELVEKQAELRQNLLRRAAELDYNSLLEAKVFGDLRLYDEVFQILIRNDSDKLADFVTNNGLPVKADLVELFAKKLKANPSLDNLIKFVHLSAISDSAEIYLYTIETTSDLWKEKRLCEISGEQLFEILDSHYWLLASTARVSGAGYLLKERLTSMRREILESNHQ